MVFCLSTHRWILISSGHPSTPEVASSIVVVIVAEDLSSAVSLGSGVKAA